MYNQQDIDNTNLFIPMILDCVEEIANRHELKGKNLSFYICEFYEELGGSLFSGRSIENIPTKYDSIVDLIVYLSRMPSVDGYTFMGMSQHILEYNFYKEGKKFVIRKAGNYDKKNLGSYYTPLSLTQALCKSTLSPVADRMAKEGTLHTITVLDPSCGAGAFLIAAVRWLADNYGEYFPEDWKKTNLKAHIIRNCIYGVDINPYAVLETDLNLCLECKEGIYFHPNYREYRRKNSRFHFGGDGDN